MSLTALPSGLVPAFHPSGQIRSIAHKNVILSGTNVSMFKGQPVKLIRSTGGAINGVTPPAGQMVLAPITATTDLIYGVLAGVEYVDATGMPQESNFWPANLVPFANSVVTAFIWEDPAIVYTAQFDGSVNIASPVGAPFAALDGRQANFSNFGAGSTSTGLSQCTLASGALPAAGAQGQVQLYTLDPTILNQSPADPFPQFQVRISNSQLQAVYLSI